MKDRQVTVALAGCASAATTAPGLRHIRPWRWVLRTDRLELHADAHSPLSREESLVTCGAAVHRATIALAAEGLAARVDLFPGADPQHVATLTPAGPVTAAAPLPAHLGGAEGELGRAAAAEGLRVRRLAAAEVVRLARATPLLSGSPKPDAGTAFAVLYGGRDSPGTWIRAGRALSAIELNGARTGLSVAASAAAVRLDATRAVLRRLLPAGATPCLALRISPAPATARRLPVPVR